MKNVPDGRAAVNALYGVPGPPESAWYALNILSVPLPFPLLYTGDGKPKLVRSVRFHRLAAPSLIAALTAIYCHARCAVKEEKGYNLTTAEYNALTLEWLDARGLREYAGTYNYRPVRGSSAPSLHSYGVAIDLRADENPLGDTTPDMPEWFARCFEDQGFLWGANFTHRKDPMHFQLAEGC